jgi:hypothetical protein
VADSVKATAKVPQDTLELGNKLFSSFTQTRSKSSSKLSLAGTINYFGVDHTSEAWIGNNTDVTARGGDDDTPATWSAPLPKLPEEDGTTWQYQDVVDVDAVSHSGVVTGAGVLNLLNSSGSGGSGGGSSPKGVGGVFSWVDLDATTSAGIPDDATVDAGKHGVAVNARTEDVVVQVLPAAGDGKSVGVSGVLGLTTANNTTRAMIADSADVTAGSVSVDASQQFRMYGLAGAVTLADQAGVGLSVFAQNVDSSTTARVGDIGSDDDNVLPAPLDEDVTLRDGGGTLTTSDLDITANSAGRIVSLGVAGAAAREKKSQKKGVTDTQQGNQQDSSSNATSQGKSWTNINSSGGSGSSSLPGPSGVLQQSSGRMKQRSDGKTGQQPLSGSGGQSRNDKEFGLAAAGSAAFNRSKLNTAASLANATVKGPSGDDSDVTVRALNNTDLVGAAGSGALTLGGKSSSGFKSAVAGAASIQWLQNDTEAKIADAEVKSAGTVDVQAATAGDQVALGLGLAVKGDTTKGAAAVGSASVNRIDGETTATIVRSTLEGLDADGDGVKRTPPLSPTIARACSPAAGPSMPRPASRAPVSGPPSRWQPLRMTRPPESGAAP